MGNRSGTGWTSITGRLLAGVLILCGSLAPLSAQSRIDGGISDRGFDPAFIDSLQNEMAQQSESSLQQLLDSLGYSINVATDELSWETFCVVLDSVNWATIIIEAAQSASYATSGYYRAGKRHRRYQLFGPSDGPGDSVSFDVSKARDTIIGFYMFPNIGQNNDRWYTENQYNNDGYDHAKVFPTGQPHEYIICWEDVYGGGDQDHQDLVFRVTFYNDPPEVELPEDYSVIYTPGMSIEVPVTATDANCLGDSITLTLIDVPAGLAPGRFTTPTSAAFSFGPVDGVGLIDTSFSFSPPGGGDYTFVAEANDPFNGSDTDTITITVLQSTVPIVELGNDTTIFACDPFELCVPVTITDPDCDVATVISDPPGFGGSTAGFDQIERIVSLGGTVTQIGGGNPGGILLQSSDFVAPTNSQSGVAVTLPNFVFADTIIAGGSFPVNLSNNGALNLLGAPTDITFTTPGAGGPDGGSGDGSIDFSNGQSTEVGFTQIITSCYGAPVDFYMFTNTGGGGTVELTFKFNGSPVWTVTEPLTGGSAGTGFGGLTVDLPDGISFNSVEVECVGHAIEVDAFAARVGQSPSTEDLCIQIDTSGTYEIIVSVTDSSGNTAADTQYVFATINTAPTVDLGPDQNLFVCALGEICLPVVTSDPDNNITSVSLISGPGTITSNQLCYTPTLAGQTSFVVQVTDSCGATDLDTVTVTVGLNAPPVATMPSPQTVFQCAVEEICQQLMATDPNGGPLVWSLNAGVGSVTPSGLFCFTPTTSGTYNASVTVTDSCGAADTITVSYTIELNQPPVADDPTTPVMLTLAMPDSVCFTFTATDTTATPISWAQLLGDGTVAANGEWCFFAPIDGTYQTTVVVTDSCGAADTTTLTYIIDINDPPDLVIGDGGGDTAIALCDPTELCFPYTVSDPQGGGLTEVLLSGFGAIDTAANEVCFTPTTDGAYDFIIQVTDSIGASVTDTFTVTITFGDEAMIVCPGGPIDIFLCATDTICQELVISPAAATVSTSFGTILGDSLCFVADTSGTYVIDVIASAECGDDTCQYVFDVEIGSAAQISCPTPAPLFLCSADTVAIPVGVNGTGVSVSVSPVGSFGAGMVKFLADTAGTYELTIIATSACGVDTCVITQVVEINSAPVANAMAAIDTFLCTSSSVCTQLTATDPDGGSLTWSRLSGDGTVSASGEWCVSVTVSGEYSVTAVVTDSCGAADTVLVTLNGTVNSAPTVVAANDTTIFQCSAVQHCFGVAVSDADNNLASSLLTTGPGIFDINTGLVCFLPDTAGTYTFIIEATDSCGAIDADTTLITIERNSAPTVTAGPDQTLFQCTPTEVCWPASATDADGNLATVTLISGPGTFDGSQICFTPTGTLAYEFVLEATDSCGATATDTVVIDITINTAPVATAAADTSVFLCSAGPISIAAGCSDVDGNLATCELISGAGTFDGSLITFTPAAPGVYSFVIRATDACGAMDLDTVTATVAFNSAPICSVPNDTMIVQCSVAQVCLPVSATDVDGNLVGGASIISGPGTIVGSDWCYTPVASQSVSVTIQFTDACGAVCSESFVVDFVVNNPPSIAFDRNSLDTLLCASAELCFGYTVGDPNDPRPRTVSLLSGPGTLDTTAQTVCFTPTVTGTSVFVIEVVDECGVTDVDTLTVDITLNSAPIADAGPDLTLFLCANQELTWTAGCSDVDGNLDTCLFDGAGTFDGTTVTFTPNGTGSYPFIITAIDECGAIDVDTAWVNITLNTAPTLSFGADSSVFQCTLDEICVPYTTSDPDGGTLIEAIVTGFGTLDAGTNTICFTPTGPGSYEIIASVTDSCGAVGVDTIVVTVTVGDPVVITCPTGPVMASLCSPDSVCQALPISPAGATVTVSQGTYTNGTLCIFADTSGTYLVEVIASDACGADTCLVEFQVDIGSAATVNCPSPSTVFLCAADQVCVPVGVMGTGAAVSVSPIGSYANGQVCFPADTAGNYLLTVIASTSCGSDTCQVDVTVDFNAPPVAVDPPATIDTFLCVADQICYQFAANDGDAGPLTWNRLSGDGAVSPSGEWCFTASGTGSFSVTAVVADTCGAADTVSLTYNVILNSPPTIDVDPVVAIAICDTSEVCVPVVSSDPDAADSILSGSVVLVSALPAANLNIDLAAGQFCFTPGVSGNYRFAVTATDSCGLTATDSITVAVTLNDAPIVSLADDTTLFLCSPTELCFPATCADPNANLATCELLAGAGVLANDQICFTADTAGVYTIIVQATDSCGASDTDTLVITVELNSPPVCELPNDTAYFQCTATEVTLPVGATDVDGNFDRCELVTGPGQIVNGIWSYTPTMDQTATVTVLCLDSCGASCTDSFTVVFDLNDPPVVDAGVDTSFFLCGAGVVCWDASASDPNGNLATVEVVEPANAEFSNGEICLTYNPTAAVGADGAQQMIDETFIVILEATDSCGLVARDTTVVTIDQNTAPTIDGPTSYTVYLEQVGEVCIAVPINDEDDNLTTVTVSPLGVYNMSTSEVCFTPDSTGTYCLTIEATDACGATVSVEICVTVQIDECILVEIEDVRNALQGQTVEVDIQYSGSSRSMGGFDFLIRYDNSALSLLNAAEGELFTDCGWEYFEYRTGANGNCTGGCPDGVVRVIGIADINNGANHPGCYLESAVGTLASLQFLVSNNRALECQYAPIEFIWYDCGDNSVSSRVGDTLWVSRDVFNRNGVVVTNLVGALPNTTGVPEVCLVGDKKTPQRCVDFTHGGVDIICADSIDDRGDLNVNGLAYEIADAVMFVRYFLTGISAFNDHVEASIAASDVNADGNPLTVGDLVFMIRTIVGDELPLPKVNPDAIFETVFTRAADTLMISETSAPVGGLFILVEGAVEPEVIGQSVGMQVEYHVENDETRIVMYDIEGDLFLNEGPIVVLNGGQVRSIEVGSYAGGVLSARIENLPTTYSLEQNYPNPFNPTTTISFSLPYAGEWQIEIYNILGQLVEEFGDEAEAGNHTVEWDAGRYASGVYFYRLQAGSFSATKKMVLLK